MPTALAQATAADEEPGLRVPGSVVMAPRRRLTESGAVYVASKYPARHSANPPRPPPMKGQSPEREDLPVPGSACDTQQEEVRRDGRRTRPASFVKHRRCTTVGPADGLARAEQCASSKPADSRPAAAIARGGKVELVGGRRCVQLRVHGDRELVASRVLNAAEPTVIDAIKAQARAKDVSLRDVTVLAGGANA